MPPKRKLAIDFSENSSVPSSPVVIPPEDADTEPENDTKDTNHDQLFKELCEAYLVEFRDAYQKSTPDSSDELHYYWTVPVKFHPLFLSDRVFTTAGLMEYLVYSGRVENLTFEAKLNLVEHDTQVQPADQFVLLLEQETDKNSIIFHSLGNVFKVLLELALKEAFDEYQKKYPNGFGVDSSKPNFPQNTCQAWELNFPLGQETKSWILHHPNECIDIGRNVFKETTTVYGFPLKLAITILDGKRENVTFISGFETMEVIRVVLKKKEK